MAENHIAHECALTPEAATDEPASSFNRASSPLHDFVEGPGVDPSSAKSHPQPLQQGLEGSARPLPPRDSDEFEFASEQEEAAYWAGVADGMRNVGGTPAPRLAARARDHYPELVATAEERRDRDILDFDPVSVRHRIDGWTPQKQREYVEALADSGVSRYAAARVGMSEQSVNRLRRRPDARSFDRACEAAMRIGARRLVSVAFERAIEGTVKRIYYHGEVKSEERVYDNRLLMALIGKLPHLFEEPGPEPVEQNWQPWMEAIEQGLPEPVPEPNRRGEDSAPAARDGADADALDHDDFDGDAEDEFTGAEVWESDGEWWTDFPPPDGFDGVESGEYGDRGYRRTLSPAERSVIDADLAEEREEKRTIEAARRDRYFGFAADIADADVFPPMGCEPCSPSEPSGAGTGAADGQAAMS